MDPLPDILPIDKIPAIKELEDPQFLTAHADASLTTVSAAVEIESKLKKKKKELCRYTISFFIG